ncbi:hypothetical protein AUC70_06140 [Methyloceanibacter stevinii]|uniref:Uncharacterized protein n=1 Tax=Methyloceanibacter stevinii TaxID=1774970 RepID=A0A1E3VP12_9HYPH|nr:hypothetical protein [Methyloceanibacter stevinii]ODR95267.1 hypothetical protein AUC70_06140 [Methyloceanibacter stevinii]
MTYSNDVQSYGYAAPMLPAGPYLLRTGATGAMIAGGWAAVTDLRRMREGEISRDEAIKHTVTNAAIGAGAGVLVGTAAHLARNHPLAGVAVVLAAGAGALYLAGQEKSEGPTGETGN